MVNNEAHHGEVIVGDASDGYTDALMIIRKDHRLDGELSSFVVQ